MGALRFGDGASRQIAQFTRTPISRTTTRTPSNNPPFKRNTKSPAPNAKIQKANNGNGPPQTHTAAQVHQAVRVNAKPHVH